ncbi:MAG: hypothetical protein IRY87_25800 [Acetobacteraceae bacterium]|nr:hypothetical protein [Acetobacteraceae bacterium]
MILPVESLPARIAATPALRRWGRHLDADVLLEVGAAAWLLTVREGEVLAVRRGPFVLPSFTLALRLDPAGFARFLAADPPPGWHDLMALRRHGALRVEGDLVPFFAHLFWFKGVLALLREGSRP